MPPQAVGCTVRTHREASQSTLAPQVESDNYLAREKYMAAAAAQMRVLRLRAAHLCASDGLCANSEEVGAIRTGAQQPHKGVASP